MRATALTGLISALFCAAAAGGEHQGHHGVGHDPMHDWYKTLRHPGTGYECCDGRDCRPTRARHSSRGLEVQVDGEWTLVPPDSIVKAMPPDGSAHVCAHKGPWHPKVIFCVVLPPGV